MEVRKSFDYDHIAEIKVLPGDYFKWENDYIERVINSDLYIRNVYNNGITTFSISGVIVTENGDRWEFKKMEE
jgi:hypothetical protein